jgi:hypothetical protein
MINSIQQRREEYRSHAGLNQSSLKALLLGVENWGKEEESELFYEEKTHLLIGTAVDMLITESKDAFEAMFYVSRAEKPSDAVMSIVQEVFAKVVDKTRAFTAENYGTEILEAANSHEFATNWKAETRVKNLIEKGHEYWSDLYLAQGKSILSGEEMDIAEAIHDSLLTSDNTSKYLTMMGGEGVEVEFQYPVFFTYRGHECKMLLDQVIIDHNKKQIQPIDAKSTGRATLQFPGEMKKFRYDIQAAFYTLGLQITFPDYDVLPFKFIVETTKAGAQGKPLVYTCTRDLLKIGRWGRGAVIHEEQRLLQRQTSGFEQALNLYEWYVENGFNTEKIVAECNGDLPLSFDSYYP